MPVFARYPFEFEPYYSPSLVASMSLNPLAAASDAAVAANKGNPKHHPSARATRARLGIEGMMQSLADELHDTSPIRVNSIDPGPVRSDLRIKVYPGTDPSEWAIPEDIIAPYLYLMGPDSKGVTGQAFDAQ